MTADQEASGWLRLQEEADALLIAVGGHWDSWVAERHERALSQIEAAQGRAVRIDLGAIETLDTASAWLLFRLGGRLRAAGAEIAFANVAPAQADLFERLARLEAHILIEPPKPNPLLAILNRVGRGVHEIGLESRDSLNFLGLTAVSLAQLVRDPRRLRIKAVLYHMEESGLNAVPIVALMSFLIGVAISYQGALQLTRFGAQIYVVDLVAVSVLRELAIVVTAIIVAGRSGSAFTAQIGAMKINEEIDAMKTLGLDPMQVLVVPRLIALAITLPLLGFIADLAGLAGGALIANLDLGISPGSFVERLGQAFSPWSFGVGLVKAPVFAAVIALTGCFMGLKVTGSAESVGLYTTRSVVHAIVMVIVIDALFSVFFAMIKI